MSEVKRYEICGFEGGLIERKDGNLIDAEDFDRVTAERDAALYEIAGLKDGAHTDGMLRVRYGKEIDALQQRLTAADERVGVLEGALVATTPSKVCKCRECGGTSLTWYSHIKSNSGVDEGRLRTGEMSCVFFLGCDDCSETLAWMDADKIAAGLPIRKP